MFRNNQKKWKPSIEYYQIFVEDEPQQEGTFSTYEDEGGLPISHPDHNQESNATPKKPNTCAIRTFLSKRKAIGLVRKEKKKQKIFKDTTMRGLTYDESNKFFDRKVGIAKEK